MPGGDGIDPNKKVVEPEVMPRGGKDNMRTLEQYLKDCAAEGIIDFSIRATVIGDDDVTFYIHPDSKDGDTVDFSVNGNLLKTESDTGHNQSEKGE